MTPLSQRLAVSAVTASMLVGGVSLFAQPADVRGLSPVQAVRLPRTAGNLGGVTYETYQALRPGMMIDEVRAIVGIAPSVEQTNTTGTGVEIVTLGWEQGDAYIVAGFANGVLVDTATRGLSEAQGEAPDGAGTGSRAPLPVVGNPSPVRAGADGTRSDPFALGTPVRTGDFAVTVHSVRAFASDEEGDAPGQEDSVFVVADVTVTNHGEATTLNDALPGLIAVRSGFSSASPRQHLSERGCALGDRLTFGTPIGAGETVHGTTCWEAAKDSWDQGVLRVPHSAGSQGERSYVALASTGASGDAADAAGEEGLSVPVWVWVAAGVLILGVFVGFATRGALKTVDKDLFDGTDESQRLKTDLEKLSALAPTYADDVAPGDAQPISEKISRLVEEVQELLRRLKVRGTDRHLRLAQAEYAGMLDKIVMFVDPEYLKSILDNPHRWHHPDKRVTDVVAALDSVHDQVVENIRQANSKADLNFEVAMASLAAVTQEDEFRHLYQGES